MNSEIIWDKIELLVQLVVDTYIQKDVSFKL